MGPLTVARRGHVYPSVRLTAADLVNARVGSLGPGARVADALALATRLGLAALVVSPRGRRFVLRADLRRAASLDLGALAAERLARPLPVVDTGAGEVRVRRHLAGGAPLVVVREGGAAMGAVAAAGLAAHAGPSLAGRVPALLTPAVRSLLARIGALAEGQGGRAFAVGGVVRDALRGETGAHSPDIDVVVEGDGLAVARLLASELPATLVEHERFLTASVRAGAGLRVDIATARREHYAAPGALPEVRPASIDEDLRRRDFTVNAMAAELSSGAFLLVDPLGGQADLRRRRLRVLHPLSFVEDPTRIFRAARYGARLALAPEPWTAACLKLALELAPYPALSGQRIVAELELILREPRATEAVAILGALGALRLVDQRYRYAGATAARVGELDALGAWAHAHALAVSPVELLLVALLTDQAPDLVPRALRRLGVTGEPYQRLLNALAGLDSLRNALRVAPTASARARLLRGRPAVELVALWLSGDLVLRHWVTRFLEHDRSVEPWLNGEEIVALGIPRGPQVAPLLAELRDGRLDETIATRAAAEAHVRRRAGHAG